MTAKFGLAFGRWTSAVLAVVALSFGSTTMLAQETDGKIEGIVLDPNGQPVAGAQVLIVGTAFAAQTSPAGYYFINRVPAGIYNVRAQFIGLQPAEIQNVRVLGGQTITVDYNLQGAIALEAIAITAAENPLVPRDQVTSRATLFNVHELPVSDPLNAVAFLPGVVVGRDQDGDGRGDLLIRGGRANEAAIFIDGAPVRSNFGGGTNVNLGTNTVEELAVTSGALGSEFGDAQSGVISFVTRAGGPSFAGSFSYETDEPFGDNISVGLNRFEGSLSGPILGNLTLFVGGTLEGQASDFQGKGAEDIPTYVNGGVQQTVFLASGATDSVAVDVPLFVQFGGQCDESDNLDALGNAVECQGRRFPFNWTTRARLSGKLQLTYGSGSRISLSSHVDRDQSLDNRMRGTSILLGESLAGIRSESGVYVLNWVQQVTRGVSSAFSFDVNASYQTDEVISGPLETAQAAGIRQPSLGIHPGALDFLVDFDRYSDDTDATVLAGGTVINQLKTQADWDQLIFNIRTGTGTIVPFKGRRELSRATLPRVNAYGVREANPFFVQGSDFDNQTLRRERRFTLRANADWQAGRFNRIKFGGEYRTAQLNNAQTDLEELRFNNIYSADPVIAAFYVQNRLDLGDVVIEVGGRWDRYDARARHPLVPGRTFTHPDFDAADLDPTDPDAIDPDVWVRSESHTSLSPRLRVSFPITEKTGFRLSYAHQTQTPNFNDMLVGANNDLSFTNTNERFGGDVDFAKTIIFEFGVRHAFSRDMVLDIAAYQKDKVSDWTYRILPFFDPFSDRVSNVNILTNADFGNVRGVDIGLQRRFSNIFSGQISYTLASSKSTGSDPLDFLTGISRQPFGVTGERTEAPEASLRTRDDRTHNIQGSFALTLPADYSVGILRNFGAFASLRVRSGLPYTRLINTGGGNLSDDISLLGLAAVLAEPLQASETPWTKFLDLRVTKQFGFGATSWTVYTDIRNVFNFENRPVVFSETGDLLNENYFETQFLTTELLGLLLDAQASGADRLIPADGELINAIDLSACAKWLGAGGPPACLSLVNVERRFGDGDGVYDLTEQTTAIRARYDVFNAPHTILGAPRHIRVGIQLDF